MKSRWHKKYISIYHNVYSPTQAQRGLTGLVNKYSENCWASTPPPLLVARENWLLSSWEMTCIVVTLQ